MIDNPTPLKIDFNVPTMTGKELEYIAQAFENRHISGDGVFTRKVNALLENSLGVPKVLLTTSCTHALEMAALLLDIHPGDEVIVPDFTFVSTINAFVLRGAKPVFVDIRPDTLNLNANLLEQKITPTTRAILPVHYAGVGCDMDEIMNIASTHKIAVVEDNAHGLFGKFKGKYLGTFGSMATQSFHETKNFTCGEGGALLINDSGLIERAEIIREKGTNRSRFFRGMIDRYTWVDIGSSFLPSEILAAILCAQLEHREQIQNNRKTIWEYYFENLKDWAGHNGVELPYIPPECDQSYHMFYMIFPSLDIRTHVIQYLKSRGIMSVFHYLPLNLSEMGMRYGGKPGDCPVTESISDRLLRLPFYSSMTRQEQDVVISALKKYPMKG
jgi:dTDP-4-amino-4,6-dideoxygalactose transaminase